ncbi:MAG: amino acid ABC transporter substrate-binding protein [Myxococcales bacterium]|nr:amino acid ABC transporter substrate-binding protein [Myxococcales bacterium]MCB9644067.1 amino acid ABC transporter substrate-binding protein [Myxococcales bacterium]
MHKISRLLFPLFLLCSWALGMVSMAQAKTPTPDKHADPNVKRINVSVSAKATSRPVSAAPQATSQVLVVPEESVVHDILSSKTLRICTRSDIPPFGYFRDTQLVGLDIELARELVAWFSIRYKTHIRAQWVVIRAADRIPYLQRSLCDVVVASFSKNAARAKQIAFSSVYFRTHKAVLARSKAGDAPIIGLVRGATAPQTAFKGASFAYFYSYSDIVYAMKRSMLDYVVADAPMARYMLRMAGKVYRWERELEQTESYAIGVHKKHTFLQRELDLALSQLTQQGRLAWLKRRWTR